MIFENDGQEDFFEIILSDEEIEELKAGRGIQKDFPKGLYDLHNLNVFIRPENLTSEE